jgi:hypothetical protein
MRVFNDLPRRLLLVCVSSVLLSCADTVDDKRYVSGAVLELESGITASVFLEK